MGYECQWAFYRLEMAILAEKSSKLDGGQFFILKNALLLIHKKDKNLWVICRKS